MIPFAAAVVLFIFTAFLMCVVRFAMSVVFLERTVLGELGDGSQEVRAQPRWNPVQAEAGAQSADVGSANRLWTCMSFWSGMTPSTHFFSLAFHHAALAPGAAPGSAVLLHRSAEQAAVPDMAVICMYLQPVSSTGGPYRSVGVYYIDKER